MTERYSFQKPVSSNCSGEILRTKSAGSIDIEHLEKIRRELDYNPEDFIDLNYKNDMLRPARTFEEMKGGFYLTNR